MILKIHIQLFPVLSVAACVALEARLIYLKVESINLGCFNIPPSMTLNNTEVNEGSRSLQGQVVIDGIKDTMNKEKLNLKKLLSNAVPALETNDSN